VASRSGILTKVDLVSDMVQEFPELQGIMGYYYALAHNEREAVASAIKTQYTPSFAGDILPESLTACSVALADKLDLLTGIYGIGLKPTGDKDPFALRRAAIGIVRILREKSLALPLDQLISWSLHAYRYYAEVELSTSLNQELITFIFDRLRYLLKNEGINYETFQSVRAVSPSTIPDFMARIKAVSAFSKSQSCYDLAMANKRVSNILQKNNITEKLSIDHSLLKEKSESELMQEIEKCEYEIKDLLKSGEYFKVLSRLTKLKQPVNQFFDHVVIMDNSESIKLNRLGLIQRLHLLFKQVAAIGELSV
jgi:glycyl-tRNA synthetase beta chain